MTGNIVTGRLTCVLKQRLWSIGSVDYNDEMT